jgi:hypothetical protein
VPNVDLDQFRIIQVERPAPYPLNDLIEAACLRSDHGDAYRGALPGIVMVDLGCRQLHATPEVIEQGSQPTPFLLERRAVRKPELETKGGSMHRSAGS